MTEISEVQTLIDLIVKLIRGFASIGSVFGELINFVLNLGLSLFKISVPDYFGTAVVTMASLLFVIYSITKNLKLIYIMFGVIILLMGVGSILQFLKII